VSSRTRCDTMLRDLEQTPKQNLYHHTSSRWQREFLTCINSGDTHDEIYS